MKFSTAWAMPNRWTFRIKPIREFVSRSLDGALLIADPFCGTSEFATHANDLAKGGIDARAWCRDLIATGHRERFDAVVFDPPYSPRQIAECYRSIGKTVSREDTQNAVLYAETRELLRELLRVGGVALSFGWQSSGFGKGFLTREILLVQHGGAHNDTICVRQVKTCTQAIRLAMCGAES